ncbi:MAG: sigma-70 family RNA polymerase sigma factor [Patescibacteria group bacterium]
MKTKRDPEAFARIYDRHVEAIFRFAYLKLPRKEDAQDVTAETFTKTWQYLNENTEVVHIRALLYRIARNLIADFYRGRKHEPSVEELVTIEGSGASQGSEGGLPELARLPTSKSQAEPRAELALVFTRLTRLKEDYRDVLMLRLVDDLPFSVIAEILGKTQGNVRVIYHRGIKALNDLEPNP